MIKKIKFTFKNGLWNICNVICKDKKVCIGTSKSCRNKQKLLQDKKKQTKGSCYTLLWSSGRIIFFLNCLCPFLSCQKSWIIIVPPAKNRWYTIRSCNNESFGIRLWFPAEVQRILGNTEKVLGVMLFVELETYLLVNCS